MPDHSTLSRFCSQLVKQGLSSRFFDDLNQQLERRDLMVKLGTLIDANLVAASVEAPRYAESTLGAGSELDPDADWTQRKGGGGSHFGTRRTWQWTKARG